MMLALSCQVETSQVLAGDVAFLRQRLQQVEAELQQSQTETQRLRREAMQVSPSLVVLQRFFFQHTLIRWNVRLQNLQLCLPYLTTNYACWKRAIVS